jgi:hypothetical protein
MAGIGDIEQVKRLRGAVLELVYSRHRGQQSRMDHVALWNMLIELQHDAGENDVITVLQDLKERGYTTFAEKKNRFTNRTEISLIQITPKGRDLVEAAVLKGASPDAAVVL